MQSFSAEKQTARNFTYQWAPEFNSASVIIVRDKYDPLLVFGSIEKLKRKWFAQLKNL